MENENLNVIPVEELAGEKKTCHKCGRTLPITSFFKSGRGYRTICIDCSREEHGTTDKFREFSSRELIEELKSRGYKGTLTKTIIKKLSL